MYKSVVFYKKWSQTWIIGKMEKKSDLKIGMLPRDIQSLIKKRIVLRIIAFLFLEAISVFLILAISNSYYDFNLISLIVVCAVVILFPFVVSGFPLKLINKPWRGRIISVEVETKSDACMVGGKPHIYIKNSIVLTIEKENGKFCTKEVLSLGSLPGKADHGWERRNIKLGMDHYAIGDVTHDIENYHVGDEVYHFYGLDDLIVRREGGRSIIECVACSTTNPVHRKDCFYCGRTLVHSFEDENK